LTVAIVAAATFLPEASRPSPIKTATFAPDEILSTVAREMRSADAAAQVLDHGVANFSDGTWYISVDEAQFHFSQRNRIVVADNAAAVRLEYGDGPRPASP
jgi:hypothetical protein